jgi:hypothetical protein
MDNKTYYEQRLNDKHTWLSFCDAMRNDTSSNSKNLLDRLKSYTPNHPRIQILQDIYDKRDDNKK